MAYYDNEFSKRFKEHYEEMLREEFLNTENTEDVSTTSSSKSERLYAVSEWNAERSEPTKVSEGVVEGALAKRTDDGNKFYCGDYSHLKSKSCDKQCSECIRFAKFMESS